MADATATAGRRMRATRATHDRARARAPLPAAARLWALAASFACQLPLLLQLPGVQGLAIGALAVAAAGLSWRQRLPALARLVLALAAIGLVFASGGLHFGRDTGCALLAAMLAIKPVELFAWRDARSLLGFAFFAPFATFLLDQGPLSLALGLAGALVALAALWRLAELESATPVEAGVAPVRVVATRVRRVGTLVLIGLPLALTAFWLFPRLPAPLWGVPERAVAQPGLSGEMAPGEWLDLMADDTPALRARFFDATPERGQMYWRGPVLVDFDGRRWTRSEWMATAPRTDIVRDGPVWDYELELEPTERPFLVALDLPLAAPAEARLTADYSLLAWRPQTSLRRWRLRSAAPAAFDAAPADRTRDLALRLPDGFNPRTLALARDWRAEAGDGPAADTALIERMLAWVRRDFTYTLATPLPGRHGVDEFLFDRQAGFCEHYSAAFAVFMRAAGVPARVVTGYAGGYYNRFGDYWLIRRNDAHAWVEVWLDGRGWTRVDPTAAVAPERIHDTLADLPGGDGGGAGARLPLAPVWDIGAWMRRGWNDFVLGFDATRQRRLLRPLGGGDLQTHQLIVLFAALGGLALAWMLWLVARGERERDPVLRAWHALGARYRRHDLAPAAHEPASAWTARVLAARPGETALAVLSARFDRWRYAAIHPDPAAGRRLVRDLHRHRPAEMSR